MSALPAIPPPPLPDRPRRQISAIAPSSSPGPAPSLPAAPTPTNHDPLADSLLAAVAAGNQSLTQIAAAHNIPFPQFSLWLLKPETQQQLTQLSRAVASATRLSATAALPEVVGFLKKTLAEAAAPDPRVRQTLFPIEYNERELPTPAQVFKLRRQRVGLSASYLLLRLARLPDPASAGAPAPAPAPQRTRDQAAPSPAPSSPRPSFAPRFEFPPQEMMPERKEPRSLALTTARAALRSDSPASAAASPPAQPVLPALHARSQEPRGRTESGAAPIRDHPCNPWPASPAAAVNPRSPPHIPSG